MSENPTVFTEEVNTKELKVYPRLASDVTVTGHATANTYGSAVELVPVDTITEDHDFQGLHVEFDQVDEYFVQIGEGADGEESWKDEVVLKIPTAGTVGILAFIKRRIKANTRIAVRIATVGGGSDTAGVRYLYT
jgi:hypothetical protein